MRRSTFALLRLKPPPVRKYQPIVSFCLCLFISILQQRRFFLSLLRWKWQPTCRSAVRGAETPATFHLQRRKANLCVSSWQFDAKLSPPDTSRAEEKWRKGSNYLLASSRGLCWLCCAFWGTEKRPLISIHLIWIRSCTPTDLLCASWEWEKKKKTDAGEEGGRLWL